MQRKEGVSETKALHAGDIVVADGCVDGDDGYKSGRTAMCGPA